MEKIVKVVVDLALEDLDKEFDYILPLALADKIKIGQILKVPFGSRKIKAFVTGFKTETELERSKLKKVDSIVYKESFFDSKLLALFKWIANYYHSYLAQVIKSALPAGITDQKITKKKLDYISLNQKYNIKKELRALDKRAYKQRQILEYLLAADEQRVSLEKVLAAAETSKNTVKRLIDKDLVILYNKIINRRPELKVGLKEDIALDFKLDNDEAEMLTQILSFQGQSKKYLLETANNPKRYYFILKIIENLIKKNKKVIVLVPEIKKDYIFLKQLEQRFKKEIAFLHSRLSQGEFFDEWQRLKRGEAQLAVGARSAIFAPLSDLDAVIIMEENNENYKQQEHPLFHVRQTAVKRLQQQSLLILESPAASIESDYMAEKGHYRKLKLKAQKSLIQNKIIDLRKEVEAGNLDDLSRDLKKEIEKQLTDNNKIALFLNRRGSANYVICRKCGQLLKCDNCNISLNYHQKTEKLCCHYCGFTRKMPSECPNCGSKFISPAGIGTQKLSREIKRIYPEAVSARIDSDLKEAEIDNVLKKFRAGKIDILIATSILLRNQFYQDLKFLAVIEADTVLNSSDFRAAEKNYFLLRELRSLLKNNADSKILLQSYQPEHYSLKSFTAENNFYKKELQLRRKRNYPPFCRLLNIIISSKREEKAENAAKKLEMFLNKHQHKIMEKTSAAPAALNKIRKKYRWQLILKFKTVRSREYVIQLIEKLFLANFEQNSGEIRIDVDPYQML